MLLIFCVNSFVWLLLVHCGDLSNSLYGPIMVRELMVRHRVQPTPSVEGVYDSGAQTKTSRVRGREGTQK